VLFLVLVLRPPQRTVLVRGAVQYSNPAHWSASSREPLRSTIGSTAVQTAIEYDENKSLTRSQRRGRRYFALILYSTTRPSAPAWILSSINAESITVEKGSRHGCLQWITSTSMTKSDASHERQCRPSTCQQGFYFETDLRGLRSNILLGSTQSLRKKPKR